MDWNLYIENYMEDFGRKLEEKTDKPDSLKQFLYLLMELFMSAWVDSEWAPEDILISSRFLEMVILDNIKKPKTSERAKAKISELFQCGVDMFKDPEMRLFFKTKLHLEAEAAAKDPLLEECYSEFMALGSKLMCIIQQKVKDRLRLDLKKDEGDE